MGGFWLLLILLILLFAAMPWYPYSRSWGYSRAGIIVGLLALWFIALWFGWILFAWPGLGPPAPDVTG